jgi:hypothetical protein
MLDSGEASGCRSRPHPVAYRMLPEYHRLNDRSQWNDHDRAESDFFVCSRYRLHHFDKCHINVDNQLD